MIDIDLLTYDNANLADTKTSAFATSIEPGQTAQPCSVTRLYTVGWPSLRSNLDIH